MLELKNLEIKHENSVRHADEDPFYDVKHRIVEGQDSGNKGYNDLVGKATCRDTRT